MIDLSIVIPVYRSEDSIQLLLKELSWISITGDYEVVFVNDCSPDSSREKLLEEFSNYPNHNFVLVDLSKNFGEHNAVMAGLRQAQGEYVVTMDDDLQNPIDEAVRLYEYTKDNHCDVVFSYYKNKQHNYFRNLGSKFTNYMLSNVTQKPRDLYLSSFRCFNRSIVDKVVQYKGPYPYVDGIILQHTDNIDRLLVKHSNREIGSSSYSVKKLVRLWMITFVNFSVLPLRLASLVGGCLSVISFIMIIYTLIEYFFKGSLPDGWTSLFFALLLFSGVQLLSLGLIGEYIGRIYLTLNHKPQYSVSRVYKNDEKQSYGAKCEN